MNRSISRRLVRVLIGLLVLLVTLTAASTANQARARASDQRHYPPPGNLIDVGGHSLHLYCVGDGNPTVIMEAGLGNWSIFWSRVQPEIAQTTRVCSYDRAGYGWSDPGPLPRTSQVTVDELHTLLSEGGIEGPYVLVGHSFGGYTVRLYTAQYPDDVAGVVLVDAAHEDMLTRLPPEYRQLIESGPGQYRFLSIIAQLGVTRWVGKQSIPRFNLPPDMEPVYYAVMSQPHLYTAFAAEIESLGVSASQVREAGSLGDLPLVVLSASDNSLDPALLPPDFPAGQANEIWRELQTELTGLSSDSTQIIVEDTGHNIHLDQPEVVIDAIIRLVERERAGSE